MPFLDAQKLPQGHVLTSDVAVVGAGAAGIPLAAELEEAGLNVLLIESGGRNPDSKTRSLSEGSVADARHGPLDRYRERVFGGTTRVWGGRVAPLDEIDFASKDRSPGWPIGRGELDPYYRIAHRYLAAGQFQYDPAFCTLRPGGHTQQAQLSSRSFHQDMLWRFSKPVDLGKDFRERFAQSALATVLLNATCVSLELDDDGVRVIGCRLKTLGGKALEARASVVVLATGGLETTRILLNSSGRNHESGVGNANGDLGRFYASHMTGTMGPLAWNGSNRLNGLRYERDSDGTYVRRTLSLRPTRQLEDGLVNFRATVSSPPMSDPSHQNAVLSAAFLAKRFLLRRIPPEFDAQFGRSDLASRYSHHVRNVTLGFPQLVNFGPWWLVRRVVPDRRIPSLEVNAKSPTFFIHFDAEQTPVVDSTVVLGGGRDALGVRRLHVDWRFRDEDVESIARTYEHLVVELAEAGVIVPGAFPNNLEDRIATQLGVGSHHIGTTRMSSSAQKGVVDKDCRVHGTTNLFVASSSTFPTTGVANPTLTIVALAVRLGRTLARELGVS